MKLFKKFLCTVMLIIILTLSVGSSYLDARHMTKVNAAVLEITAGTLFEICLIVGAAYVTVVYAGHLIENNEDIARVGKNFIDSVTDLPDGWVLKIVDSAGQPYVFGSEALKQVQETSWTVIQGGNPDNDDNDDNDDEDDEDDGKFGIPKILSTADQLVGGFTALGATWLIDSAKKLYQKWVNGEELTEAEAAVFEPILSGYVTDADIADQWSGESFEYIFNYDYFTKNQSIIVRNIGTVSAECNYPVAASVENGRYYRFLCLDKRKSNLPISQDFIFLVDEYYNGVFQNTRYYSALVIGFATGDDFISLNTNFNFPVFPSRQMAEDYLLGILDVSNSLNYAKVYQNADWLSDDWAGQLVDPLTDIGLTLSQLLDLMKALGLNAVGNNLSPEELLDMIKEALPAVNPDLQPDHVNDPVIEPDPNKPPIYYPSPDAWPDPDPGTKPDPDPGTDPDDPSGGDQEDPGNNPDIDRPNSTWVVDLSKYFPFCIPFDLIHLLNALDAEPQAPRFEFPLKIPAYGVDYTFVIDLSDFNTVASIFRTFETLLFILGLILLTRHLIRG